MNSKDNKENNKKFAEGICFYKLFIIFIIGCIFGVFYEEIVLNVIDFLKTGVFEYETRRGLIYGPFSPVYGAGAVAMCLLAKKRRPVWQIFIYAGLAGGLVEYLISFLQEKFTGTISWDYSGQLLNIGGRTGLKYIIIWGLCGLFLVYVVYPFISKLIEKIPVKIGNIIMPIIIILMSLDMIISFSAVIRQTLRRHDIKPYTFIGEFYDKYYPDEKLKKVYNNMIVTD